MVSPILYTALMGLVLFFVSWTFSRVAARINSRGYVPGMVLLTSLPGLATLIGLALFSSKQLPATWLHTNLIVLALAFVSGMIIGLFFQTTNDKRSKL